MKPEEVTIKDSISQTESDEFLYCPKCRSKWSANATDYPDAPMNHVFNCDSCRSKLILVKEITTIRFLGGPPVRTADFREIPPKD